MRTAIILTFFAFCFLGNAQLIDPFGKIVTHEIKLTKLEDGAYVGAMEWATGGIDSLQRFVVNGLDIQAPVMVRIVSKAPDHNIDLSFHKENWDKAESKISTNGDKFADKIFRTMSSAGLGVSSNVAGIPYLIIVKVGLKFPVTKSLIRVTDDKEEYNRHLRKMGISGNIYQDENTESNKGSGLVSAKAGESNNTLLYTIIGLLAMIILLLAVFLTRKQKSKNVLTLLFVIGFCTSAMTQSSNAPKPVPISGQGESPVFYEYRSSNVGNQNPVPITTVMNSQEAEVVSFNTDGTMTTRPMRIDTAPGVRELTGEEATEVLRRIKEANEEFDREYRDNMPGRTTEDGQRIPNDFNREEMNRLKRQVRELRRQVELLSQEDEEHDADADRDANTESPDNPGDNPEILVYCEDLAVCMSCLNQSMIKLSARVSKFRVLQKFYSSKIKYINRKISFGNGYSQIHPVSAIVWQNSLSNDIMPAVMALRRAYNEKFDQYLESLQAELNFINECPSNTGTDGFRNKAVRDQAEALLYHYRSTRIMD